MLAKRNWSYQYEGIWHEEEQQKPQQHTKTGNANEMMKKMPQNVYTEQWIRTTETAQSK